MHLSSDKYSFNLFKNGTWITAVVHILLLQMLLIIPVAVNAHTEARSSFSARTDGSRINFDYRLNAISIVELVERAGASKKTISKSEIDRFKDLVLDYVAEHVVVTNNGKLCKPGEATFFGYAKAIDKVVLKRPVLCPGTLKDVEIDCSLFLEEPTAHGLTATFYHIRAKEQYVFWGHKIAVIHVDKLHQAEQRRYVSGGHWAGAGRPSRKNREALKKLALLKEKIARQKEPQKGQATAQIESAPVKQDSGEQDVQQAQKLENAFITYVKQGISHILGGLDHVLFILSLVIVLYNWRRLTLVLTSFTIAHSITLALGVFNLVKVSPYIVEPLVALSILYVAVENVFKKDPESRVAVTFGFGLIHGLGFSAMLQNLGLDTNDMVPALLGFNVGVEIGQLLVVAPLFPVIIWIHKNREKVYQRMRVVVSALIGVAAAWWMVERIIYAVRSLY